MSFSFMFTKYTIPFLGSYESFLNTKGIYNGSILAMPHKINDEVEEREIIR